MATISSSITVPPENATLQVDTDTSTGEVFVTMVNTNGGSLIGPGKPAAEAQIYLTKLIAVSKENNLTAGAETFTNAQAFISEKQNAAKEYAAKANAPAGGTDPNNLNGTASSDENPNPKASTQAASTQNPTTASGSNQTNNQIAGSTPSTQAGQANSTTTAPTNSNISKTAKPGNRLDNPLSRFSSYTYQLTLYMITPDAYNAFILSGRKNINAMQESAVNGNAGKGGAFIVAQSGGLGTTIPRAPGFKYDYYIDDLKIKSAISGKSTGTASNAIKFSFSIYEPYGFSFITKLKLAQDELNKLSTLPGGSGQENPSRQFFVLGIRFQGYDKDGDIADSSKYFSQDTYNNSPNRSGVYERFYDIAITQMKFKINGAATTYNIDAVTTSRNVALSVARGVVDTSAPITASTVGEAISGSGTGVMGLFKILNDNQEKMKAAGRLEKPMVYKIAFLGDDAKAIRDASLLSDADRDKRKWPGSTALNKQGVNEATANEGANPTKRVFTVADDTPIPQAISKIISLSDFLEGALKVIQKSEFEFNEETKSPDVIIKKDPPPIKWYNLSTELKCLGYDNIVKDYAYEITYIVQVYDTPSMPSPYVNAPKYYGPYKKYNYWFTGQNSEILNYEQSMDNTFFNVAMNPDGDPNASSGSISIPTYPNKKGEGDKQDRKGAGPAATDSITTSLYSPGDWATAKITILGDPDYLMRDTPDGITVAYNQYYGSDGFTINPNGGQVFIEINFNEAVDYDNDTGTMSINNQIYFWSYPKALQGKVQGVNYMVREVDSTFSKGKFTQVLTCNVTAFDNIDGSGTNIEQMADSQRSNNTTTNAPSDVRTTTTGTSPTPSAGSSTSSGSGLLDASGRKSAASDPRVVNLTTTPEPTTPTQTTTPTNNPATPAVQSSSNEDAGKTQAGAANSTSPDAGREKPYDTSKPNWNISETISL